MNRCLGASRAFAPLRIVSVAESMFCCRSLAGVLSWGLWLFWLGATVVSAQTTGVAVTSVTRTSAATVAAGGNITYTVAYTAGSDRVTSMSITLEDESGFRRALRALAPASGSTLSLTSDVSWLSGNYKIYSVSVGTAEGGSTFYYLAGNISKVPDLAGSPTSHSLNLASQGFQLTGGTGIRTPVVVTSVTRTSAATMTVGGNITYTVAYTAGSDRVTSMSITLEDEAGSKRDLRVLSPTSGGTLSLTSDASWLSGNYKIYSVSVGDAAGSGTFYYPAGHISRVPVLAGAPTTHNLNLASQGFQLGTSTSGSGSAPAISTQPESQSAVAGGTASFSVTASGAAPLAYRWSKNGAAITGATSATLTLSNVQSSDAASYTVVVSNGSGSVTSTAATLTVNASNQAPAFTQQPVNATATDGGSFTVNVRVTTTNLAEVSWRASVAGRTLTPAVASTAQADNVVAAALAFGPISLADAGAFQIIATNSFGSTFSQSRTLTVNPVAPSISTQPRSQAVAIDARVTLTVVATGTGPLSYQWRRDGAALSGATGATYTIESAKTSDAGSYTVVVSNRVGSVTSAAAEVTVSTIVAPLVAPAITTQPASQTVQAGATVTFTVAASGTAPLSYQWQKDGAAISGATSPELILANVAASDAASYTVTVTNTAGTAQSSAATLSVVVPEPARLINLSLLTALAEGESFTLGFVVGGDAARAVKPLLIRAGGPSLAQFGVADPHGDPALELFAGQEKTAESNDWGGAPALGSTFASVGAYPFLSATSKDAALHAARVPSGSNSVRVSGVGATRGTVLAELYETTPAREVTTASPRLINVSVMKNVGTGMTVGFVIGGTGTKTVLVRAVGPGLSAFGVTGVLADPELTLFGTAGALKSNDNWGADNIAATMQAVGAFALVPGSKDAALVASLTAGSYTLQVAGVGGANGTVLVEVYEVP